MTSSEWEEWLAEHAPTKPVLPLRIRQMHATYGVSAGKHCRTCVHLLRVRFANVYRKCSKAKMTASAATDWKATWPACGLYSEGKSDEIHPAK